MVSTKVNIFSEIRVKNCRSSIPVGEEGGCGGTPEK